MKMTNLYTSALTLATLLLPLAAGLIDVRILFLILFVAVIVARRFFGHQEFTQQCIDIAFYAASLILTLYFVDMAISHGMFPFFNSLSNRKGFADMLALWVILQVVFRYVYTEDKVLDAVHITAGVVAELTLAVNGEWGAQFFMLMLIAVAAAKIMPFAERMKRVLQLFFGAAFILCNMSLLFNYTKWLQVENVTYSLETSVVCELVLSILALYVLHEWEKIPADTDIDRVRLCRLQHRIKRALKIVLVAIVIIGLIGYDMGIGSQGTKIAFLGENGEGVQAGIFANTAVSLLYHVYGAFQEAVSGNILGTGLGLLGLPGAALAILFMGICIWLVYRGYRQGFEGKEQFAMIAAVEMLQLLLIPISWELLPMYVVFLYTALEGYLPKKDSVILFFKRMKDGIGHMNNGMEEK